MAAARILSQAERLAVDAAVPALLATQTRKSPTEAPQVEAVPDDRRAFAPRRQPQPVEGASCIASVPWSVRAGAGSAYMIKQRARLVP